MTRAQILRKRTGIVLAVIGIILSLLPAVRMSDGSKLFIFQLIGNEAFFHMEKIANEPSVFLTGLLLSVVLIYGLLIHILNLILWLRKTEKTYLGQMGFSWASFIAMVMSTGIISVMGNGEIVAVFPITLWQTLRILIILFEAIIKLNGEELFNVFFPEK